MQKRPLAGRLAAGVRLEDLCSGGLAALFPAIYKNALWLALTDRAHSHRQSLKIPRELDLKECLAVFLFYRFMLRSDQ
jgi:hypothetical protein